MRLRLDHPAVVTGLWEDGKVRHELVRVGADFEFAEYSSAEAPLSFEVRDPHQNETVNKVRTIGGRHFQRWKHDEPSCAFGSDANLMRSLYHGKQLDFRTIESLVEAEIQRVRRMNGDRGIENTNRKPLKRELLDGLETVAVSCMKAPLLKNWQRLGADVSEEVKRWHDLIAEVLANIVLVDGAPYVRTFEPCYRVEHPTAFGGRFATGASISANNAHDYAKEPDRLVINPETGFERLGELALVLGFQNFAATDLNDAIRFCQESGWHFNGNQKHEIIVHDSTAIGIDYLEMETARHARMLHQRAEWMIKEVRKREGTDVYCGEPVDVAVMRTQIDAVRSSLLLWQTDRTRIHDLAAPFEDLLEHSLHWEDAQPTKSTFDHADQMEAFKLREDMVPIRVSPITGATLCV
jgi:hypothetical protein